MIGQGGSLRADDNLLEAFAGAHDKAGATVLEPIGTVFVNKSGEMEVVPGRSAGAVGNGAEIFLVEIVGAGEVGVGIRDDVAVGIGVLLEQPGKDVVGVIGILDA